MGTELSTVTTSYREARRRRAELLEAIRGLEEAVAAPAGKPAWPEHVRQRLVALRERLADHIVVTEGPDGLYAELLEHAPRLRHPVDQLVADHGDLLVRLDAIAQQVLESGLEATRARAGDLLAALSRHRQRGADLVYEAYATDIGGET